jgi:hypothetical protein
VTASSGVLTSVTANFVVSPATPAAFTFNIDTTSAPFLAGDTVPFTYTVTDFFGNDTGTPVIVSVSAPSVVITNDGIGAGEILGLVHAMTYTVRARAVGTLFSDTETVTINPNPGDGFNLVLSSALVVEDSRLLAFVYDAFGNSIDLAGVTFTVDGAPINANSVQVSMAGNQITFGLPGTYSITATLTSNPTLHDTELVSVQGVIDTLPPTAAMEVIFPSGTTTVAINGRIEVSIVFDDNRALGEGMVYAQFGDVMACTAQSPTLVLSGFSVPNTQPVVTTVRVPGCAFPLDRITLVAKVTDQAGNIGYSSALTNYTVYADPASNVTASTAPAYVASLAARNGNLGNGVTDVAVDMNSGALYVSESGNNRVRVYFPDRSNISLADSQGQRYNFNTAEGVTVTSASELLIGDFGTKDVYVVPPTLPLRDAGTGAPTSIVVSALNGPSRLNYEGTASMPLACVARASAQNDARCYSAPAVVSATLELTVTLPAGTTAQAIDAWVAAPGATTGVLWLMSQDCRIYTYPLDYSALAGAPVTIDNATAVSVGQLPGGGTCLDLAALPSGDAAVANNGTGEIWRVAGTAGAVASATLIADSFQDLQGLDYGGFTLFALDGGWQSIYAIQANAANPF